MKLSILIPTIERDREPFNRLKETLRAQLTPYTGEYEVIVDENEVLSIGFKRNHLLYSAEGEYCCFIDSDDRISDNYIQQLMKGISLGVDCCSLKGLYTVNGNYDGIFEHSLMYKEWKTVDNGYSPETIVKYQRYPNHLNCIKSSIAKQFKFPETNFGEDHDWSKQIHESGLINTEYYIKDILYYYDKRTK